VVLRRGVERLSHDHDADEGAADHEGIAHETGTAAYCDNAGVGVASAAGAPQMRVAM
jgi:hypothetical protein